jgi:hypothetical protein
MLTPGNVMHMLLLDSLEGIGITPKRMARFSQDLSEAVHGYLRSRGATAKRYIHITSKIGGEVFVHWPAKTNTQEDWAVIIIDLKTLQKDFHQLLKKYWLKNKL